MGYEKSYMIPKLKIIKDGEYYIGSFEYDGETWTNPYDDQTSKIRCIHLSAGNTSKIFLDGVQFVGGTGVKLRILCKNYNDVNEAEIAGWLNGTIREV